MIWLLGLLATIGFYWINLCPSRDYWYQWCIFEPIRECPSDCFGGQKVMRCRTCGQLNYCTHGIDELLMLGDY